MVSMDRLRLTQEWNEVSGYWKPSGVWLLLQVLQPFEQEEELPVSVREIWFNLRTMATFPEETGVWTFGSQFNWHIFVSELIQELRSVVRGLVPFAQQMEFICYDTVDIQNEDCPCLDGNAGENASLVVALNNPILLIPGDHSLLDSSSDERCADESLSHIATENMSTAGSRGGLRNSDTFSLHKSKNAYYGSKNLVLPIGKNCGSPTEASESEFEEAIDCSRLNKCLTRKNKGAGKVSKPVDLEAAACNALLQGHQKRKQKRRKDKQTNAGCGEFDIPNEEFPCLGSNAGENASLVVALNNPIILTTGDQSLLDSSSDERCTDESLSHIATENMSTEGSRGGLRNSDTFSLHQSKNAYCGSKNLALPIEKSCGSTTEASKSEFEEAIDCSRSNNCLVRKNKGAGKASKPVDLEAATSNALLQWHQKRKQKRRKDKQIN